MPDSLGLIRGFLAILCIVFAYFLGRSVARRRVSRQAHAALLRWGLRTMVTVLGVMWGAGLDRFSLAVIALAVVSAVAGFYFEQRPRKEKEDLTDVIFPKN